LGINNTNSLPYLENEPLLLRCIAEGDWDAYTRLFNYYLPKLSQYIYPFTCESRQDTEEVIQEVFLKIWEKKEFLSGIKSFDSYLFRMAKNKVIDLLRKQKAGKILSLRYYELKNGAPIQPENEIVYNEYQGVAKMAITQLSPKLQEVFIMRTQEEFSLDEIASKLHIPKDTVKKRLYLATTFVKAFLRKHAEWIGLLLCSFGTI
jgi:RNA polymerase sigma-70 factor (ECF subfamily)